MIRVLEKTFNVGYKKVIKSIYYEMQRRELPLDIIR
jgi:hypothetical protein